MKRLIIVLLLVFTCFNPSFAQRGKPKLPVVIEAQKLTYNDVQKRAVYVGNVVAQHGKTILNGDKLIIYFTKDGKEIKKIVVIGNVHIKSERGEGWCDQLIYYPAQEKAVLIGNAKLKQGKNILVGDRIVAYRSGRVEVVGQKRRVKTVIFPEEKGGESKRP
ncbi:MAG: lipopolysaccharide transport periplasmic protein LptA [Desulfurobacteriaceae bacterium]